MKKILSSLVIFSMVLSTLGSLPFVASATPLENVTSLTCEETSQQLVLVSQAGDTNAVATYEHPAWTADDQITGATWIWSDALVQHPEQEEIKTFPKDFSLPGGAVIDGAELKVGADNNYTVTLGAFSDTNTGTTYNAPVTYTNGALSSAIASGLNNISFTVTNLAADTTDPQANPAGLIYKLTIDYHVPCEPVIPPCPAGAYSDPSDNSGAIRFESSQGYSTTSINGQQGWSNAVNPAYDQGVVVNTYGYASFDAQSLRMSDAVASGSFGDWVFAPPTANGAGETGATAGTFSTGTLQNHFEAQFDIASTRPCELQEGLHMSVSPDRGDGSRMSYLRFEDQGNGMHVFFDDVSGTDDASISFNETDIATLQRDIPHKIKFVMDFVDGASNDVVKIYIDGVLAHTGTSWENYFRYDTEAAPENTPRIVKTLIFQVRGTSHPLNLGKGYLIDNLTLTSSTPQPTLQLGACGAFITPLATQGLATGYQINTNTQNDTGSYDYLMPSPNPTPADSADHHWVHLSAENVEGVWDMGGAVSKVWMIPSIDHGPFPGEYNETLIYYGDSATGPWTLANRIGEDANGPTNWDSDNGAGLWQFTGSHRYVRALSSGSDVTAATAQSIFVSDDAEVDAICAPVNEQPLVCSPDLNLLENGGFEAPALSANTWDIIPDSNSLLKWLVAWANPQESGRLGLEIQNNVAGAPFADNQHAELDGDHPVTIWQNIATIPGKEYSFSFQYSPRPGRDLADDSLQVKVDNAVLGADVATDGTANGNTVWETITRTFVAIGATTKVEIYDNGTDTSYGGYVDNADLRCVGDPQDSCKDEPAPISQPFSLICNEMGAGQLCATDYSTTFTMTEDGTADVDYTTPSHCSAVKIHTYIDGVLVDTSGFFGWPGDPLARPMSGNLLNNHSLSAGTHTIALKAEGELGGCNTGTLYSWGGTLDINTENSCKEPSPVDGKVHLFKFINGEQATSQSAGGVSFPMNTPTYGNAPFTLGPNGWTVGDAPYEASTSEISAGGPYTANENLTTPLVSAVSCEEDNHAAYQLEGYSTGSTLSSAIANGGNKSLTPPNVVVNGDSYIIVWNKKCGTVLGATTLKVHIYKYLNNDGPNQVPDNALGVPQFPMTATWMTPNLNGGASTSGDYVLGNNHGGTALQFAADTSPMEAPADYTTSEITDGSVVVPTASQSCPAGKYRLLGYKSGDSLSAAQSAGLSPTAPVYTDISADQYVIVVNEKCPDLPPPPVCEPYNMDIVSNTSDIEDGNPAVAAWNLNPAWTASIPGATWIWDTFNVLNPTIDETKTFSKTFNLPSAPTSATLDVAVDNTYKVSLNLFPNVFSATDANDALVHNFTSTGQDSYNPLAYLNSGSNTISFEVTNLALQGGTAENNPAGLLYKLHVVKECVPTLPPSATVVTYVHNENHGVVTSVPNGSTVHDSAEVSGTIDITPFLGTAGAYGVLSSTFTANGGSTAITGDAGYTSTTGTHTVSGVNDQPAPPQSGLDQATALASLNGQGCTFTFAAGAVDLATDTTHGPIGVYTPGVYCTGASSAASIGTGGITLSGAGTHIFRIDGALTTVDNSTVSLTAGATAADVFWTPTGATTLGANTTFKGTVIDDAGITVGTTTAWIGRALAFGGTVTTNTDTIMVPASSGPIPTGDVDFTFYSGPGAGVCDSESNDIPAGNVILDVNGVAHPSDSEGPLTPGTYAFRAHYNGDNNYGEADGPCEPFTVLGPNEGGTAHITIKKKTYGGDGTFHFTGLGGQGGFDLTTTSNSNHQASSFFDVFADVNGESYTVTEDIPLGWNLTSTYCHYGEQSAGQPAENGKTVTVHPGDEVTCTFVNTKIPDVPTTAEITVIKHAIGGNGTFTFTDNLEHEFNLTTEENGWSAPGSFIVHPNVGGTTYNITETDIPSGWNFTTADCQYDNESQGTQITNGDSIFLYPGGHATCTFTNTKQVPTTANLSAVKIICPAEADLPNWSGADMTIDASTASSFIENHPNCHVDSGWQFEWSLSGNGNVPSDNQEVGGSGWTAFTGNTTIPSGGTIWVREQMQSGYVPFTGAEGSNVSAEMWCYNDVLNYDNLDFVSGVETGGNYHCVGFNVPVSNPNPTISSGGGGGGGSGKTQCADGVDNADTEDTLADAADPGCHNDGNPNNPASYNPADNNEGGAVLGAVLGDETSCGIYVDKFLRKGYKNNSDAVKKVQKFLNDYLKARIKEDGNYGSGTESWVKKFQSAHADKVLKPWGFKKPTGIFYLTTQTEVNNVMCPPLNLPIPPLTPIETNPLAPIKE